MSIFHQTNATRLKPWLCATTVPLFAFTRVSLGAQQPPWDECRAPKTEYEIPERNFFAANQRRRQSKDRPLVAAPPNPTDRRRGPPARRCPRAPGALGTFATGAASQDDNVFKLAFVTFISVPGMGAHGHSRRPHQPEVRRSYNPNTSLIVGHEVTIASNTRYDDIGCC
jgi:hypothetical protein